MLSWRKFLVALGIATVVPATTHASSIVEDVMVSAERVAKALNSSGYKADFSLASLKEVDRFFDEQAVDGHARPNGLLADDLGARLFSIGSYIGEVIRRNGGGEWQGDDSDPRAEINVALKFKTGWKCFPIQRAMKRFKNGPEDAIYPYGVAAIERSSKR